MKILYFKFGRQPRINEVGWTAKQNFISPGIHIREIDISMVSPFDENNYLFTRGSQVENVYMVVKFLILPI